MTRQTRGEAVLGAGIDRRLVLLLAFVCGAAVATMYYAQPLLYALARAFSVSDADAGLLVTATQVGYVVGLALLAPLGDLHERRRLITAILIVDGIALGCASAAPGFAVFALALAVGGGTSAVPQIIVAMASSLAAEPQRGRVVGTVMSGLLIGILTARTVSGLVAGLLSWRVVYAAAAVAIVLLALVLRLVLPRVPATERLRYRALLRSVVSLIGEERVLRQRMMLGACGMGCYTILWTSLAFLLSGPPYHYGTTVIGLFGLAGIGGAMVAPVAGRAADHGHGHLVTTATILALLTAWGLLALGRSSIVLLLAGIVVLELGVQGTHISNLSAIYALRSEARARLTTAYMVAYFVGGVLLSAATVGLYASGGWEPVCALGAITGALTLAVWAVTEFRRGGQPAPRRAVPVPIIGVIGAALVRFKRQRQEKRTAKTA